MRATPSTSSWAPLPIHQHVSCMSCILTLNSTPPCSTYCCTTSGGRNSLDTSPSNSAPSASRSCSTASPWLPSRPSVHSGLHSSGGLRPAAASRAAASAAVVPSASSTCRGARTWAQRGRLAGEGRGLPSASNTGCSAGSVQGGEGLASNEVLNPGTEVTNTRTVHRCCIMCCAEVRQWIPDCAATQALPLLSCHPTPCPPPPSTSQGGSQQLPPSLPRLPPHPLDHDACPLEGRQHGGAVLQGAYAVQPVNDPHPGVVAHILRQQRLPLCVVWNC